jgi:cellulose synthase/poly-beta-1,6-N-acetylglucosamine synthase-like glycosyltransferase
VLRLIALLSFAGLIAVWVVYPSLIAAIAAVIARCRRRASPVAPAPHVSVIIATRDNDAVTRTRVIDCLLTHYDAAKLEIVVAVDRGHAFDDISALTQLAENVRIVRGDEPGGKAATLNAAVRASVGSVLVFTDVWQRFDRDAISNLVKALQHPDVGAVSGSLELPKTEHARSLAERYWLFERWLRSNEAEIHSCAGVTGAIWAMRRELWLPLPDHLINDDMYTPMHIVLRGQRVLFARDARAFETRQHRAADEFARKVRTLTGVIQICAWLPSVLNPWQNPIWIQFVFHKLLRLLTPYWMAAVVLWLTVAFSRVHAREVFVLAACAGVAVIAAYIARARTIAVAWDTLVSGTLLQAAAIVGTVNGLRGRWNVWATSGATRRGMDEQQ